MLQTFETRAEGRASSWAPSRSFLCGASYGSAVRF